MSTSAELTITLMLDAEARDGCSLKIPYHVSQSSTTSAGADFPRSVSVNLAGLNITISPIGNFILGDVSESSGSKTTFDARSSTSRKSNTSKPTIDAAEPHYEDYEINTDCSYEINFSCDTEQEITQLESITDFDETEAHNTMEHRSPSSSDAQILARERLESIARFTEQLRCIDRPDRPPMSPMQGPSNQKRKIDMLEKNPEESDGRASGSIQQKQASLDSSSLTPHDTIPLSETTTKQALTKYDIAMDAVLKRLEDQIQNREPTNKALRYYVAVVGRRPGIYIEYTDYCNQVKRVSGGKGKSFRSRPDAERWYKQHLDKGAVLEVESD